MPLLIGKRRTQDRLLRQRTTDDLKSDRKSRRSEAARDGDPGEPREIQWNGRNILQIHL